MKKTGKIIVLNSIPDPRRNVSKPLGPIDLSLPVQEEEQQQSNLPNLPLPKELEQRLFPHQKYGVNWMYKLHNNGVGGLLGDEMGLGKTFQVVALLTGLILRNEIKRVLIISPVSVLLNWEKEIREHLLPCLRQPDKRLNLFPINSDITKKKRLDMLYQSSSSYASSIVIGSHQIVSNMIEDFAKDTWDYVILDEGHVIKNSQTKLWKSMQQLPSKHRILCTGTPIQNNLTEFWALMDWATKGTIFGSMKVFTNNIADPIAKGQDPNARPDQIEAAVEAIKLLVQLTKPVLLQRKKKEKFASKVLKLPEKKELVLWISLSSEQRSMYEQYVNSRRFKSVLTEASYPVEVINYLRTLCRHSLLLECSARKREQQQRQQSAATGRLKGFIDDEEDDEDGLVGGLTQSLSKLSMKETGNSNSDYIFDLLGYTPSLDRILRGSVKLRVLMRLISNLFNEEEDDDAEESEEGDDETNNNTGDGHRLLIFSQSKLMLQIIQYLLAEYSIPCFMIDGSTSSRERQSIINEFNNQHPSYSGPRICLLTTKACGVGITLTAADRVIIFDPSWNPAEDSQAVDRVYRIGQTKDVIVYRFILVSCIEEKIYEKQVFKEGLRVVSEKGLETEKYFKGKSQLLDLLSLRPDKPIDSIEILQRIPNHPEDLLSDRLHDCYGIAGCTRHDQLYYADSLSHNHTKQETNSSAEKETEAEEQPNINPLMTETLLNPEKSKSRRKKATKPSHPEEVRVVDEEEAEWSDAEILSRKSTQTQRGKVEPLVIDLTQNESESEGERIENEEPEELELTEEDSPILHTEKARSSREAALELICSSDEEDEVRRDHKGKRNQLIYNDEDEEEQEYPGCTHQYVTPISAEKIDPSDVNNNSEAYNEMPESVDDLLPELSQLSLADGPLEVIEEFPSEIQNEGRESYLSLQSPRFSTMTNRERRQTIDLFLDRAITPIHEDDERDKDEVSGKEEAENSYDNVEKERNKETAGSSLDQDQSEFSTNLFSVDRNSSKDDNEEVYEENHQKHNHFDFQENTSEIQETECNESSVSHTPASLEITRESLWLENRASTGTLISSPENQKHSYEEKQDRGSDDNLQNTSSSVVEGYDDTRREGADISNSSHTAVPTDDEEDCDLSNRDNSHSLEELNDQKPSTEAYDCSSETIISNTRRETILLPSTELSSIAHSSFTEEPDRRDSLMRDSTGRHHTSFLSTETSMLGSEYYENSTSRFSLGLLEVQEIYQQKYSQEESMPQTNLNQEILPPISRQSTRQSTISEALTSPLRGRDEEREENMSFVTCNRRGGRSREVLISDYCNPDIFFSPPAVDYSYVSVDFNNTSITGGREESLTNQLVNTSHQTAVHSEKENTIQPSIPSPVLSEKDQERDKQVFKADFQTPSKVAESFTTTPSIPSSFRIKAISTTKKKEQVLQQWNHSQSVQKKSKESEGNSRDSFLCMVSTSPPL